MLLPVQGASLSCIMQNTGSRSIMSVPFPPPLIFCDSLFLQNLFPTLLMTFEVLYDLFSSYLSNLLSHYALDTSGRGSPRAHPSASPGLQAGPSVQDVTLHLRCPFHPSRLFKAHSSFQF